MCGICGFTDLSGRDDAAASIEKMAASLRHRGFDAGGSFIAHPVALAHQRLSILDLDHRADQPMLSADGRYVIVFNGEIYNFRELQQGMSGFVPRTSSDTEILLELWAGEGPACLNRLNGMFAFAIYDRLLATLCCARDRLGVKPFYYWHQAGHFVFASEAKAILQHSAVKPALDRHAISDYLSLGYITGSSTAFSGINKLEPGHYLIVRDGQVQKTCWWNLAERIRSGAGTHAGNIVDLLSSAIDYRLISDVPVGSFLSGGVDSSAITAMAARKNADMQTFTIGFTEKKFDESSAAAEFAASLQLANHCEVFKEPDPAFLQKMVGYFDQPFADTSTVPFFQLCRNAAVRMRSVLCGDGGDELFAGYETRRADLAALIGYRSLPFWKTLTGFGSMLMRFLPADRGKVSWHYKLRQFCEFAHLPPPESHFSWRLLFDEHEKRALLNPDIVGELGEYRTWNRFEPLYAAVADLPILQQQAIVDLQTWLPDDILYKADQASMANTLEVRAPFLDYRLVEAAFAISERRKFSLFKSKSLLRHELAGLLPQNILARKKEGFGSPVSIWLEGDLAVFFADSMHDAGFREFFPDTSRIMSLYEEHRQRVRDNGYRLWALLMFAIWLKEWRRC